MILDKETGETEGSGTQTPSSLAGLEQGQLGSKEERPFPQRLTSWWIQKIDTQYSYIQLLACCFITGLLDSAVYISNTIFVATGTSNQNNRPYGWARSLCSIGCFIIGSFCFSRLNKYLIGLRRGTLFLSFAIQLAFVIISAAIIQGHLLSNASSGLNSTTRGEVKAGDIDWAQLAPIGLLSFQAAGQIVASRTLGVGEVPTVVITSLLCDLMSDVKLGVAINKNPKRNKRFVAFVLTLVGGIVGGWLSKGTGEVQSVLWLVAGIKFALMGSWLISKVDEQDVAGRA
ncbi:hypothetical protein ACMFMF_009459 [Clarireedia jacksonii]